MTNEPTPLPPLLHEVNKAAARLGVSRAYLYGMISADKLRVVKLGRRTLIAETELQRVVAQAMQEAA